MYSKVFLFFSITFFALSLFKPGFLILAIPQLIMYFSHKSDEDKEALEEKHRKEILDLQQSRDEKQTDSSFQELVYLKHQLIIERFNRFFDLGLYDGDIYEIAHSPTPYEELEQYVAAGPPSFEEAYISLKKTVSILVRGIILLPEKANVLEKAMFEFVDECFEHHGGIELFERYTLEEENCPSDCIYLVGKINYFFISLELLTAYAEESNEEYLLSKCKEIIENSRPVY